MEGGGGVYFVGGVVARSFLCGLGRPVSSSSVVSRSVLWVELEAGFSWLAATPISCCCCCCFLFPPMEVDAAWSDGGCRSTFQYIALCGVHLACLRLCQQQLADGPRGKSPSASRSHRAGYSAVARVVIVVLLLAAACLACDLFLRE